MGGCTVLCNRVLLVKLATRWVHLHRAGPIRQRDLLLFRNPIRLKSRSVRLGSEDTTGIELTFSHIIASVQKLEIKFSVKWTVQWKSLVARLIPFTALSLPQRWWEYLLFDNVVIFGNFAIRRNVNRVFSINITMMNVTFTVFIIKLISCLLIKMIQL